MTYETNFCLHIVRSYTRTGSVAEAARENGVPEETATSILKRLALIAPNGDPLMLAGKKQLAPDPGTGEADKGACE